MKTLIRWTAVAAALMLAACSADVTAPRRVVPAAVQHDLTCRSGYIVAYDENGDAYCAPAGPESGAQSLPVGPLTSTPIKP